MKELPSWLLSEDQESREFFSLISPDSPYPLEELAREAQSITQRRFGRTVSVYAPLYLSNYCSSGCVYCGFASDRSIPRQCLDLEDVEKELACLKNMGIEDVLLLTGERTSKAGFEYLLRSVEVAAKKIHRVSVEAFPMSVSEYHALADAGCSGVTIYQETYDQEQYARLHTRGPKKDYFERLETPERALEGGIKSVGLGVLLGLSDPIPDAIKLFRHARFLGRKFWRAGLSVSFPRIRPQVGGFQPQFLVSDEFLARMIFAFRIALPDVELVLSTRESTSFRDGMAGLGISRMSVASRTTVGGYSSQDTLEMPTGQFEVNDDRNIEEITQALRSRNLDVVFKNWESVYSGAF